MSFADVGRVWCAVSFREWVRAIRRPAWVKGVTLHHTAAPSLAQRPDGLSAQHMRNLQHYYQRQLGWSAGPHLFVDDVQINGMTPLTVRGVHARSFNLSHIGIEVLGDYDAEDPKRGRGLRAWQLAAQAVAVLVSEWEMLPDDVNFHRDDPRTTKSCPGRKVGREWFLDLVGAAVTGAVEPAPDEDVASKVCGEMVPVAAFLQGRGVVPNLYRRGQFTYQGEWRLETAWYDKSRETTMASVRELEELVASLRN
jgi:hypothetical protein